MKVTDLIVQKNVKRVSVYLDGAFAFGISQELRREKKLEIGSLLTETEVTDLIERDQFQRLLEKALRFLSYRPRSERELRDYFKQKVRLRDLEKSEEETKRFVRSVEQVISILKNSGQVNDQEFTHWWVEQRDKFRPKGERIIKAELKQKGIGDEIIEEVFHFSEETRENSEREKALTIAKKKLPTLEKLPYFEFRKKLSQYLLQRGFDWDTIHEVINKIK